jgi:hypothetical protein
MGANPPRLGQSFNVTVELCALGRIFLHWARAVHARMLRCRQKGVRQACFRKRLQRLRLMRRLAMRLYHPLYPRSAHQENDKSDNENRSENSAAKVHLSPLDQYNAVLDQSDPLRVGTLTYTAVVAFLIKNDWRDPI